MKRIIALLIGVSLPITVALVASGTDDRQPLCYEKVWGATDGGSAGGFPSADAAFAAGSLHRSWNLSDLGAQRLEVGPGVVRFVYSRDGIVEQEAIASQNQSGAWFIGEITKRVSCDQSAAAHLKQ